MIRILHVVGGMDRAGTETWLMHVLRNVDRRQFRMDFVVHTDQKCAYGDEVESLGSALYVCSNPANPIKYARTFLQILREHGPYDVVHSHLHHFSGYVIKLAKAAGVPVRIVHSHSDTSSIDSVSRFYRMLYLRISARWIRSHSSLRIAASEDAARSLFGKEWRSEPHTLILHCGLDLKPFESTIDQFKIRRDLNLSDEHLVIGHVGRFCPEKNQAFLLQVHAEVLKVRPNARLLLVGKGPLEQALRATADRLGISRQVIFAGTRADVPALMLGAMDVFVMPSLYEGLGLAAVEAQAAGLPTLLSDRIPREVDTGCGLVQFLPSEAPAEQWCQKIVASVRADRRAATLEPIRASSFNIGNHLPALCNIYKTAKAASGATR